MARVRTARDFWLAACLGALMVIAGHRGGWQSAGTGVATLDWSEADLEEDGLVQERYVFTSSRERAPDPALAIVEVDDASQRRLGMWPWPRARLARLLEAIESTRPAAVGLNVVLDRSLVDPGDQALARALARHDNVYLSTFFGSLPSPPAWFAALPSLRPWQAVSVAGRGGPEDGPGGLPQALGSRVPPERLAKLCAGVGATVCCDGRIASPGCRIAPLWRVGYTTVPSLPLLLAARFGGFGPYGAAVSRERGLSIGGRNIPLDANGFMVLNRALYREVGAYVSAADVLAREGRALRKLAGRIVLVGVTVVPSEPEPPPVRTLYGGEVPSVEVLANATSNILRGEALTPVPERTAVAVAVLVALTVAAWAGLLGGPWACLPAAALLAAYRWLSVAAFYRHGLVMPLVLPTHAGMAAMVGGLGSRLYFLLRQRSRAVGALRRFVPPSVVEQLVTEDLEAARRGVRREVTAMFADIQGSTLYVRVLSPEAFVEALNTFFTEAHAVIWGQEGTLDKFVGDGLIAFFNAPVAQEDHALRAVRAALELQRMVEANRSLWQHHGLGDLRVRVGIATGEALVGYVGSRDRLQYTIIGPAVHLASRLLDLAKDLGVAVLVSESTRQALRDSAATRDLGQHQVRGFEEPVRVYEVTGLKGQTDDATEGGGAEGGRA